MTWDVLKMSEQGAQRWHPSSLPWPLGESVEGEVVFTLSVMHRRCVRGGILMRVTV